MNPTAMTIQERPTLDAALMRQVDRSERVAVLYRARPLAAKLGLQLHPVPQEPPLLIPAWSDQGIARRIANWQPKLNGGTLLVAVQGESALGFGILGPTHEDGSAEVCALFVSAAARQLGVGTILFDRLEARAKEQGATSLLVYANPTGSAVDFYCKNGCQIIGLADKRIVSHLPWDVVFAKEI